MIKGSEIRNRFYDRNVIITSFNILVIPHFPKQIGVSITRERFYQLHMWFILTETT